jgi:hypothetical protein
LLFFLLLSIVILREETFLFVIGLILILPGRPFELSLEAAFPVSGLLLGETVHHAVEHTSDNSQRDREQDEAHGHVAEVFKAVSASSWSNLVRMPSTRLLQLPRLHVPQELSEVLLLVLESQNILLRELAHFPGQEQVDVVV